MLSNLLQPGTEVLAVDENIDNVLEQVAILEQSLSELGIIGPVEEVELEEVEAQVLMFTMLLYQKWMQQ